jgi:hypothetical protein
MVLCNYSEVRVLKSSAMYCTIIFVNRLESTTFIKFRFKLN